MSLAAGLCVALAAAASGATAPVTHERLLRAEAEPHNWLTYSGNLLGHRYSSLALIDRKNVKDLRPVWMHQVAGEGPRVETSPIVVDGILYVTERPNIVTALDGKTGRPVWTYQRPAPTDVRGCCGAVNRGVAVLDDTLFHATYDARLVALDRATGVLRWETVVADPRDGYSSTGAPLALKDKVIVGIAGGEFGIRGFLDAYDAKTGRRLWRFWTIPGPGEPGHDTWEGESWKTGGAPTWVTGTYDPALNLVYWGTGNPCPDHNGDHRAGDNLYSNSLVALDADTGALRWHFQYTPHDLHDWDSNQVPVLFDATVDGRPRKLLAHANRNGFYYVLDRETGAFVAGTAYVKQTWATGLDERGRPRRVAGMEPTPEGKLVYPGLGGGTNWPSPSYSPSRGLFFVGARDDYGELFFKAPADTHERGEHFQAGGTRGEEGSEWTGAVRALDPLTGRKVWDFSTFQWLAGVVSTGGGLVFTGTADGYVLALDDRNGKPLWSFYAGAAVTSNPVTYAVEGRQYFMIAAGPVLLAFSR
jgi:alcohol dehydrogenase (cytochrome c)